MKIKSGYKRSMRDNILHIFAANPHTYFSSIHIYDILDLKEQQKMGTVNLCLRQIHKDRHIYFDEGAGGYRITQEGMSFFVVLRERVTFNKGDFMSKVEVDNDFKAPYRAYHKYNDRGDRCVNCGIIKEDIGTSKIWYWDKNDKIYDKPPSCRQDGKYN